MPAVKYVALLYYRLNQQGIPDVAYICVCVPCLDNAPSISCHFLGEFQFLSIAIEVYIIILVWSVYSCGHCSGMCVCYDTLMSSY